MGPKGLPSRFVWDSARRGTRVRQRAGPRGAPADGARDDAPPLLHAPTHHSARVLGVVGGLISQSQRNVVVAAGTNLALTPSHTPTVTHARPRDVRPLEARANAELAAEARRVSAAWAKVKSTVATNRADAARRLTLLAAKDAERGESLF